MFSIANLLMHVLGVEWLHWGMHPVHPMWSFYLLALHKRRCMGMVHRVSHPWCICFILFPASFHVLTSPDLGVLFSLPPTSCSCPSQPESRPSRLATLVTIARALSLPPPASECSSLAFFLSPDQSIPPLPMMTPCSAPLPPAHQRSYLSHNPWGNAATLFTGLCCVFYSNPCQDCHQIKYGFEAALWVVVSGGGLRDLIHYHSL
jgi:hypothetical protein